MDHVFKLIFIQILLSASLILAKTPTIDNTLLQIDCPPINYDCEYLTEPDNSTTCLIKNFNPGRSIFTLVNPQNVTSVKFENSTCNRVLGRILFQIPLLDKLNVSNSSIREISRNIINRGNRFVTILDLSFNAIEVVPRGTFKYLFAVQELFLNNNQIKFVEYKAFKHLKTLRTLALNHNQIQYLSPDAFHNLYFLDTLRLDNNQIKTISYALEPLRAISVLTLNDNQLNYIRYKLFGQRLIGLKSIRIQNNPWLCDGLAKMKQQFDIKLIENDHHLATCTIDDENLENLSEDELIDFSALLTNSVCV